MAGGAGNAEAPSSVAGPAMRIVAVTARSPWPPTRGDGTRLLGFLGQLARRHEVTCCMPLVAEGARARLSAMGVDALPATFALPSGRSLIRYPLQVAAFSTWRVPATVLHGVDVIHLSTVRTASMIDPAYLPQAHLDFVDALSRNTEQRAAYARHPSFWRREARRLHDLEMVVGWRVHSTSCTSEADREAMGLPATAVIPNGVRIPPYVPDADEFPTILFPGNLGYFVNADAAQWLATSIFPAVRRAVPTARLLLVGARPPAKVRALAVADGVEVHADVPDMTPFFGRSWVVAAPLRYGTGLQNKVLEGFAHGRPVVTTTSVASRVPGVVPGTHLEAADDAVALGRLLTEALQDEDRRARLATAALDIARSLSWKACTERLEAVYSG